MKELKFVIPLVNGIGTKKVNIKGELDSIIVRTTVPTRLILQSEYGYVIYENTDNLTQLNGIQYIPIRTFTQDEKGHKINHVATRFTLNEDVLIQVRAFQRTMGRPQEVRLIIRYEEN